MSLPPNCTARLFQSRWDKLVSLPNFSKTWTTLLSTIKLCASSTSVEVRNPAMGRPIVRWDTHTMCIEWQLS